MIELTADVQEPLRATEGSIGYDLFAVSYKDYTDYYEYNTGVSIGLPEGVLAMVLPRSSITNKGVFLGNSVGLIDTDYTGTIKLRFYKYSNQEAPYELGERIGQVVFVPFYDAMFVPTMRLKQTERGTGGFGSTDNSPQINYIPA